MGGADISIAFADDSSKPALIHGKGMLADRPMFSPDQDGSFETLNAAKSSYTGGVLKVCFDRPIAQPSGSLTGNTVPTGSYSFLWATGKTSNGRALQHASTDRGLIFNVTLFGDAATSPPSTAVPTASVATASPSATGKSSSSEKKDLALAVFFGFAALLT
ncbi:hypothetical protein BC830DRAFT_1170867 [Chytriomyces sp. MP71]|nr:hypothetical protein BC830DRAFT_1170867 [Chytriomyces sp. MP71]